MNLFRRYPALTALVCFTLFASVLVYGGVTAAEASALFAGGAVLCDPTLPPTFKEQEKAMDDAISAMRETNEAVKELAAKSQKTIEEAGTLSAETRGEVDKMLVKMSAMAATVNDMEQKLVARVRQDRAKPTTPGGIFATSETFKAIEGKSNSFGRGATIRVDVPHASLQMERGLFPMAAITTHGASGAGVLVEEMRIPGIVELPQRTMTVRNLLAPGRTSSNGFKYIRESGFTNAAAVVSEGTQKPESTIVLTSETGNVATIAHWMHASKQILDDAPMLRSMIDNRLRYGLALTEETQLLRGDGTGDNLEGLVTIAADYNAAILDIDQETEIDEIRKAILQVYLAQYPATGVVMHPSNWARIELRKTTEGAYLMANPAGVLAKRLWGLPVVDTLAMNANEFLVGAFSLASQIFDREDASVVVSSEDRDNFIKNMVTILAEERLALANYRPEAMVTGTFTHAT